MKKLIIAVSALAVFCLCLISIGRAKATDSVQDQYCANTDTTSYETVGNNGVAEQTFHPTKDRLTDVNIKIGGLNFTGDSPLKVTILRNDNNSEIGSATVLPTLSGPSIRQWTFSSPLVLDTANVYKIRLEKMSGPATLYWYYGAGDQNCDGDSRTYGFLGGTRQSWDFNYATLGYNQPAETPATPASTPASTTPSGQTVGTGNAPATTTSAAIKSPTNLAATFADNAVKLTWTKSATADIDGYKVFRSESKTSNFKEIGKTVKATLAYSDSKDLTISKTYYYMVRAYKVSDESASSSAAQITIPETATLTVSETMKKALPVFFNTNTDVTDWPQVELYWILGGVIGVLIVLLVAYEKERARNVKLLSGRHFRLSK